jgi:lipid-A-disaccharide synthase
MRPFIDHVMALLPFEPEAHRRLGGPLCTYVGHPLIERLDEFRPGPDDLRIREAKPPVIVVLPGSRKSEIERLMPVFGETLARVAARVGAIEVELPAVKRHRALIEKLALAWQVPVRLVHGEAAKHATFRRARAALAASGTVTLELALAGVPMVAAYAISLPEALVAHAFITVPSVILANLVIGENVVPELLQFDCTADKLAGALERLIGDTPERRRQAEAFARLDEIMQIGRESPSARAAAFVLEIAAKVPVSPTQRAQTAKA